MQEVQDDVFAVLLTVKPIFPNPWWRRLWLGTSQQRRERHTREMEAIALPQASAVAGNRLDVQQGRSEGSQIDENDSQHQESFSVSASSTFGPGCHRIAPGSFPSSSNIKCPADL